MPSEDTRPARVFRPKPNVIETIFGRRKVVSGVIHLWPLPGAPLTAGRAGAFASLPTMRALAEMPAP